MIFKILTKKISNLMYKMLLLHVFTKAKYKNILFTKSNFILITIAFNNTETIYIQYKHLKENLEDGFDYVIADNSDKIEISNEIKLFCEKNNISYIILPKNPLTNIRTSGSHGIALNWCYRNIIKKYKPKYFGFLDHDIFPIIKTGIANKIRDGLWGVIRIKKEKWWYLWPGFSFFEYEKMKKYKFNFFPHHAGLKGLVFLDTGGANYYSIYKKVKRSTISEAKSLLIDMTTKEQLLPKHDSSQTFEIIDNTWLHLRQISWREESFNKMERLSEITETAHEIIKKQILI